MQKKLNLSKLVTSLGVLVLATFSLTACGPQDEELEKKPFFITIENIADFGDMVSINKPGKINGEQAIVVTSQVSARVNKIKQSVGKNVEEDQLIIELSDDIANYGSQVKSAKTALNNAVLSYNQNKINLTSSISNAENQLNQASQAYQTSQKSAKQNINQATQVLDNAGLQSGSPTALSIEKIVTDIENQINTLKSQYILQKNQLSNLLDDVLHQGDSLLGVTSKYMSINSSFKQYLGGGDIFQKKATEGLLLALYKLQKEIKALPTTNLTNTQIATSLSVFDSAYNQIDSFLIEVHKTLNNSIVGTSFPQTQIDGYTSVFNGLQTSSQGGRAGFVNYQSMVNALLGDIQISSNASEQDIINTIAKQQIQITVKNAKEAQKSAQIGLESTKISTENAISNAETALKSAQINYDTSTKNQGNQVGLLANSITQAQINYQNMLTIYDKLSVKSPIPGTIGDVFVDRGQEVMPGTPLFSIISDKEQIIEIFVTTEEHELIQLGQTVEIEYSEDTLTGTIANISYVAGPTILYKVQIKLSNTVELIGDVATVKIPINLGKIALSINNVTALQNNKGFIYILNDDNQAEKVYVDLGETRADKIEITSELPKNAKIITSDVSNYNPDRFHFEIKEN